MFRLLNLLNQQLKSVQDAGRLLYTANPESREAAANGALKLLQEAASSTEAAMNTSFKAVEESITAVVEENGLSNLPHVVWKTIVKFCSLEDLKILRRVDKNTKEMVDLSLKTFRISS